MLKLLLERKDIDSNTTGTKWGGTPLCMAAQNGYESVAELLLEREDINQDSEWSDWSSPEEKTDWSVKKGGGDWA